MEYLAKSLDSRAICLGVAWKSSVSISRFRRMVSTRLENNLVVGPELNEGNASGCRSIAACTIK